MLTSGIYWQEKGNSKVSVPIVNLGSGTNCPSRSSCPFHTDNYKAAGYPKCYACKTESRFKKVQAQRDSNAANLASLDAIDQITLGGNLGVHVAARCKKMKARYARLNESGDLSEATMPFVHGLAQVLKANGITLFTYSKAPDDVIEDARSVGVVVLKSEEDFVMVKDKAQAKSKGLRLCPGTGCGKSCLRCPKGLKSAVLAH